MDVKQAMRSLIPVGIVPNVQRRTRTESTASDRDPNSSSGGSPGEESSRRPLSEKEVEEVMALLENLPGVKESHLTVRIERKDTGIVVTIEDQTGKIVRRLSESDLGHLLLAKARKTGNLLNKTL